MKAFWKVILLLLIPLLLILAYSLSSFEIGHGDYALEKADFTPLQPLGSADTTVTVLPDSVPSAVIADTVPRVICSTEHHDSSRSEVSLPLKVAAPDSAKFRILFFGDSMLEGLGKRMCDYAMENGYDLTSIIWYSSSTKLWAETDTLQYFLDRVHPDYVMLCLGSNELFVRDLDKRDGYIATLVNKLSNYPFVWISPPNWKPDTGINELIIKHIGMDRYFDSRSLELERASDHAHPTHAAAALWMDTVASWMRSPANQNRLPLSAPTQKRPRKFHQYLLKPVK